MNVQTGDLARIVGHPSQAHCIVRVGRPLGEEDAKEMPTLRFPAWECEALCHVSGQSGGTVGPGGIVWIADRALRPLPGIDDDTPAEVVHELPLDAFGEPA
jgi:hypothetical protein